MHGDFTREKFVQGNFFANEIVKVCLGEIKIDA